MDARHRTDAPVCAIGLDVDGTKITGGVVELGSGHVLTRQRAPAEPAGGGTHVLAAMRTMAEALLAEAQGAQWQVIGIGIGVPELVDGQGNVTSAHTFDWRDIPVQEHFSTLAPAVVESDVRAAALAEATVGAGRSFRLLVYVTVGTEISSCLVQDGRPYVGARGNALILASGALTTVCSTCGTALHQILEEIASEPALAVRYNTASSRSGISGEEVMAAGDPAAVQVVQTAGTALGASVGWLVNLLDPETIVVGGGLGLAGRLYWSSFVDATRAHIWAENSRSLPILPATLGADAGLIGAALRFL